MTPRSKHIATKYHWFRQFVGTKFFVKKIDTLDQIGDLFTKGLGPAQFVKLRKLMCGWWFLFLSYILFLGCYYKLRSIPFKFERECWIYVLSRHSTISEFILQPLFWWEFSSLCLSQSCCLIHIIADVCPCSYTSTYALYALCATFVDTKCNRHLKSEPSLISCHCSYIDIFTISHHLY